VTWTTAIVEALVGGACLAMAWPCWRRGTPVFRGVGIVLGIAGAVAIVNAATELV
jgi:hypothetical protein